MMRQHIFLAIFLIVSSWQGVFSDLPMTITDDVYTTYRDGVTPTEIPRVEIAIGKQMETLIRYNEASSQGFDFNDTHVYLPFNQHVRGQFAYSDAITGEYHAGIINQFIGQQKENRLGVDPAVLTSEKWHTLYYEGQWDQITPLPPVRDKAVEKAARDVALERHATVLAQGLASGLGEEIAKAAQDVNVITDMFNYATTTVNHLANHQADIIALSQKLTMTNIPERRRQPSNNVRTFNGCLHLERMGGLVSWSEDEEGAWVPLGQPVVSETGLTSHMPAMYLLSLGTTVYMYDAETDTLEYYTNHNSRFENHLSDIYGPEYLPTALYVSPADGVSRPLPPLNGRSKDEHGPSPVAKLLWDKLQNMPIDYTYFDRRTCPRSIRAGVSASLKNFDAKLFFELEDAALAIFVQEQVIPTFSQALACTSYFSRDGYSRHSPFAFTEDVALVPFAHALIEIQPDDRLAFLSDPVLDDLLIGSERCKRNEKGIRGQGRRGKGVRCTFKRRSRNKKKGSRG